MWYFNSELWKYQRSIGMSEKEFWFRTNWPVPVTVNLNGSHFLNHAQDKTKSLLNTYDTDIEWMYMNREVILDEFVLRNFGPYLQWFHLVSRAANTSFWNDDISAAVPKSFGWSPWRSPNSKSPNLKSLNFLIGLPGRSSWESMITNFYACPS